MRYPSNWKGPGTKSFHPFGTRNPIFLGLERLRHEILSALLFELILGNIKTISISGGCHHAISLNLWHQIILIHRGCHNLISLDLKSSWHQNFSSSCKLTLLNNFQYVVVATMWYLWIWRVLGTKFFHLPSSSKARVLKDFLSAVIATLSHSGSEGFSGLTLGNLNCFAKTQQKDSLYFPDRATVKEDSNLIVMMLKFPGKSIAMKLWIYYRV